MKKYVLWPLLAAIGGVGAFLLRLLQRSTGFEVDTGLPIPGNLYAILLVAWFVVLAAVCLLAARPLLPADREDPPLFPAGFSVASPGLLTPAVMGLFLLAASGVLDLLFGFSGASLLADEAGTGASALTGSGETVTVFVTAQGSQLFSGREHLVVGLLSLLSAASLLPAVPACRIRPEGGARKPFQSPLLLVPVCCLVVRLVLTYRVVSVDPSLTDYYTELLAVVFLALAFYRLSSFAFRAGRTRRFAVYAALAIAFCLATLADRPDPARLLFYLGGAVTLFGFLLQRTAVLAAPWDNT